jgi:RNA polymerase sigma factor (sigma-70 family)
MEPWPDGCAGLVRQLEQWLVEYSRPLCGTLVTAAHPAQAAYFQRLWDCWSYHWKRGLAESATGAVDGWRVAEGLRAGRDVLTGGQLGGDVLRDVVLAEAVLRKEEKATQCFHDEYHDFAVRQAGSVQRAFAIDLDWWGDLMNRLAGYTNPPEKPGKLATFRGKCGLRNWLATVVKNHVRGLRPPAGTDAEQLDRLACRSQPEEALISAECLQLLRSLLQHALDRLDARDRLLLLLLFSDNRKGTEAAAILGIAPGNISRRKEKALDILRKQLERGTSDDPKQGRQWRDCLGHLLAGAERLTFGQALVAALEETRTGGRQP